MGKKKKKYRGEDRKGKETVANAVAVARKLYRLYGCDVHVGLKGGVMLVYWSLIRCKPEFSGYYYKDALIAFLKDLPPASCRKSEPTYPPLGVYVPGPMAANIPPAVAFQKPAPRKHEPFFGDPFLDSYEWRSLRMRVIKKFGRRCQCCGATPEDGIKIHVDHIKPRKTHPELALAEDNLQVLCEDCNHGKGNWDSTDWRPSA